MTPLHFTDPNVANRYSHGAAMRYYCYCQGCQNRVCRLCIRAGCGRQTEEESVAISVSSWLSFDFQRTYVKSCQARESSSANLHPPVVPCPLSKTHSSSRAKRRPLDCRPKARARIKARNRRAKTSARALARPKARAKTQALARSRGRRTHPSFSWLPATTFGWGLALHPGALRPGAREQALCPQRPGALRPGALHPGAREQALRPQRPGALRPGALHPGAREQALRPQRPEALRPGALHPAARKQALHPEAWRPGAREEAERPAGAVHPEARKHAVCPERPRARTQSLSKARAQALRPGAGVRAGQRQHRVLLPLQFKWDRVARCCLARAPSVSHGRCGSSSSAGSQLAWPESIH